MYNEFDAFGELFAASTTHTLTKQAQMVRSQFHS